MSCIIELRNAQLQDGEIQFWGKQVQILYSLLLILPMVNGFSIGDNLKRGNWSRDYTWQKHYHNFMATDYEMFQDKIGLGKLL